MNYFLFLRSSRFHAMIAIGLLIALESADVLTGNVVTPIVTVLLGHVGIRTFDRLGEKIGS